MELNTVLKTLEKAITHDKELYGDVYDFTFQSYSTYAIAVKITEAYFKTSGIMSAEDFTEKRLRDELINLARVCIESAMLIDIEGKKDETNSETEERPKKRTIGFRVADKSDGYKEDDTPPYPIDTYAIGYEVYDEEDYYEEEEY